MGWNHSRGVILSGGWNDSRGVLLSCDGTTPEETFCPGWFYSRVVLLSWDATTTGESFSAGETTAMESICPGMERLQGSRSVIR